jgi:enoyl-CoA hydratase
MCDSRAPWSSQIGNMEIQDLLLDPSRQALNSVDALPLGFVDLDACPRDIGEQALPAFPVIGIGDAAHPLAATLDAIIEAPISAESVLKEVNRAPHTAAIAMHVLRSLDGLPAKRALTLESLCYGLLQGSAEHAAWLRAREAAPALPAGNVTCQRQDATLHILLNRPQARNAIDHVMRDQLFEAFALAAIDAEVRAITLRSVGNVFSMGGDLHEFGTTRDPATAHLIRSRSLPALAVLPCASRLNVHVQGACVGAGLEIAAFAGRFTASANAWFQLPELSMGLIPGAGGCVSVPRRIGRQRTALMILSGRRINATTALRWGLIDEIKELKTGIET